MKIYMNYIEAHRMIVGQEEVDVIREPTHLVLSQLIMGSSFMIEINFVIFNMVII